EVVVPGARRVERDLVALDIVRGEPQDQRPVLLEHPLERRGEVVPEAHHGGVVRIVETTGLERARELIHPRGDRLQGRILARSAACCASPISSATGSSSPTPVICGSCHAPAVWRRGSPPTRAWSAFPSSPPMARPSPSPPNTTATSTPSPSRSPAESRGV